MPSLSTLPLVLQVTTLLLLFVSAFGQQTTRHDPFRAVVLQVPKKPGPPICCLQTHSGHDTAEDEVLLSFEEWKAKQSKTQAQGTINHGEPDNSNNSGAGPNGAGYNAEGAGRQSIVTEGSVTTPPTHEDLPAIHPAETVLPHFQVPTTDRFNYASLDCSARVHVAHRGAKSASSILSSKKDRYMLSPCKTPKKFVVVELCDDIRVDTVQLANYEFFSGVFQDFSISVAKTYTDSEDWTHAGTYRAKNVRGVQSFRFPDTLRDFYRYIRIDFHSHYGNEYYCPVSLLRVYGLTHLEEWKWEVWMAESRAKHAEASKLRPLAISTQAAVEDTISSSGTTGQSSGMVSPDKLQATIDPAIAETLATLSTQAEDIRRSVTNHVESQGSSATSYSGQSPPPPHHNPGSEGSFEPYGEGETVSYGSVPFSELPHSATGTDAQTTTTTLPSEAAYQSPEVLASDSTETSNGQTHSPGSNPSPRKRTPSNPPTPPTIITMSAPSNTQAAYANTSAAPTAVTSSSQHPPSSPPPHGGGESVYRTIMNKLTALETNYSLYTKYMDQQNSAIRELIKRLGEDIGRLEGATRAQRTTTQKILAEWEKERIRMSMDYGQLVSRVETLSEEILLEKRLGMAQLCLMLVVLVFMALTRGSRGEAIIVNGVGADANSTDSVRAWGKRHLSISGDWTSRWRRKSNATRVPNSARPMPSTAKLPTETLTSNVPPGPLSSSPGDRVEFPKDSERQQPLQPLYLNSATPTPSRIKKLSHSRSRTPSLKSRTVPVNHKRGSTATHIARPMSPTPIHGPSPIRPHVRPLVLQRAYSAYTGSVGPLPRSTRRWARTSHLHPVNPIRGGPDEARNLANPQPAPEAREFFRSVNGASAVSDGARSSGVEDVFAGPSGPSAGSSFPFPNDRQPLTEDCDDVRDMPARDQWLPTTPLQVIEDPMLLSRKRRQSLGKRAVVPAESNVEDDADGNLDWVDTDSIAGSDIDVDLDVSSIPIA